ncbi:hypothetical protein V500_09346 [Pseudogymnoascus sp. VKM F-4518 (FW-2643)]|nr:hypothetical protein V500_09346 [Pseudogymnoascus sp. VKM F-4518 (FW-2643)]
MAYTSSYKGSYDPSLRWGIATNLRKHAKCHLQKDSQFTIQAAGKGGRVHLSTQDSLIGPQALFQIQDYGAMRSSSTDPVTNQASTSQATSTALPPQGLAGTQSQMNQNPAATPNSPSSPLPKSPKPVICPLLFPKKRQTKSPATPPGP